MNIQNEQLLKKLLLEMGTKPQVFNGKKVSRLFKDKWSVDIGVWADIDPQHLTLDKIVENILEKKG